MKVCGLGRMEQCVAPQSSTLVLRLVLPISSGVSEEGACGGASSGFWSKE